MSARRFAVAALTVAALTPMVSPSPASAAGPTLAFSPPAATVAAASDVNVDITVAGVDPEPGLGGYDIALSFDPAVVQLTSLVDAGLVTHGQNIVICNPASIDNAAGTATASCGTLPLFGSPGVAVAAPVPLLHAVFSAQAAGSTTLSLDGSVLEDPVGGAMAATLVAGSITVPGAGAIATTAPEAGAPSASPPPGPAGVGNATAAAGRRAGADGSAGTGSGGGTAAATLTLPSTGAAAEMAGAAGSFDLALALVLLAGAIVATGAGLVGFVRERRSRLTGSDDAIMIENSRYLGG